MKYLKSKTLWLGAIVVITGALQAASTLPLDEKTAGIIVTVLGFLSIANRFITTVPLSEK